MKKEIGMNKIFHRNQIVISALALMVAVAGYLTYAQQAKEADVEAAQQNADTYVKENYEISDEDAADVLDELNNYGEAGEDGYVDVISPEENTEAANAPGTAVLASGINVTEFMAQSRLDREQVRSKSRESYLAIINNEELSDEERQSAIDSMLELTNAAEMESAAETLLEANGFENSIVTITGSQVDVVICRESLTDSERAQVEDIVKRKTETGIENIVISLMDFQE
ncbi:MAG: SpoIIIAH-like family protein [Lachnospiraceae bacterium]